MAGNGYTSKVDPAEAPPGHPLGPLVRLAPMSRPFIGRLYAAGLALAAAGMMVVAGQLKPSSEGLGTHRQLGLPPCGFLMVTGLPCPTCGMTTAYAYTIRGRIGQAIHAQAAGFILGVATLATAVVAAGCAVAGRAISVNWYRINPLNLVWWTAIGLVAAWAIKIAWGICDGTVRFQ